MISHDLTRMVFDDLQSVIIKYISTTIVYLSMLIKDCRQTNGQTDGRMDKLPKMIIDKQVTNDHS